MAKVRILRAAGVLALALAIMIGPLTVSQAAEPDRSKPKTKADVPATSVADNAKTSLPDCGKFRDWSYGQQCRRNDGKTCQVMGQRADPNELKFCKFCK